MIFNNFEDFAKACGFQDANEIYRLIASIDISTPDKQQIFNEWKINDGTKEGLMKLKQAEK